MTKYWKELALGILAALIITSAFWLWHKNISIILTGEFGDYINFTLPIVALIVAGSVFLLMGLLVKNIWIAYTAAIISVGAPYFLVEAAPLVLGTFALSVFLIVFALHGIRKEYALSIGFSVSKTAKAGLPIFFTVASLVSSLFYLSELSAEKALASFFPKSALNFTLKNISGSLESLTGISGVSPDATVDQVLVKLLRQKLGSKDIPVNVIAIQREEFAKKYGINIKGDEKISDVFYRAVTDYILRLSGPYREYLPFAAAAAFFLAFKTLTIPFYYATVFFTFLLIKIMLWSKILRSEKQQMEVEKLTL